MKSLSESVLLKASPEEVYDVLIDSKKHSSLIGSDAEIENKVGGEFSMWDGSINGVNVELVPGKKIVQKWRAEEDGWKDGHYSILTFEMNESDGGMELSLKQEGIPDEDFDNVKNGWKDYYLKPLEEMFK